ncbi:MAG: DEAD/DEAH box helicase [Clostridiales bacterium]|nr:DEAD/DEAH box helicase [Clostridiales bacterium]
MEKRQKFSFKVVLVLTVIGYILGCVITYFTPPAKEFGVAIFTNVISFVGAGLGLLLGIVTELNKTMRYVGMSGDKTKVKTTDGKEDKQYFNSRFITESELKTDKRFKFHLWQDLKRCNSEGIVIRAELKNRQLLVNMYKPIHTLVIGTTGSGKTQGFVIPTIQILSETASKPSMVIADPKGELYLRNKVKLENSNYDVKVVDLREPNNSDRWNPLDRAFDNFQRANNLLKEVKVYKDVSPSKLPNVQIIKGSTYYNEWYEFEGVAYPSKEALNNDIKALKDKLTSEAYEDIQDICAQLCPPTGQDPQWAQGAQDFIRGTLLAMLEDSLYPELKLTKDKFIFYNLYKITMFRDPDSDAPVKTLQNYFRGRPKNSECVDLANGVINNATNTMRGYMGHVATALNMFSDLGISYLTSGTDIDFNGFTDKPTALFIIIPDEKDSRYPLANIYITQLYKILIDKASKNKPSLELDRTVYFILDEFGNLPKIEKIKPFITAGRSRRLFLMLIVQDYNQLTSRYGENDAQTIKNNCNIQIFIGTKDIKTKEEFSKNCGNKTLIQTNTSESRSSDIKSGRQTSTSEQILSTALIPPEELDHLKEGEVIVNMFKEFSLRSTFTFAHKNPYYNLTPAKEEYRPGHSLDKDKVSYDIQERNKLVFKNNDDDDDDDDFANFMKKFKK